MSHCIQALVFPAQLAKAAGIKLNDARKLEQGFAIMLEFDNNIIHELSAEGPIAFVETDYFGGAGTQSATVWLNRIKKDFNDIDAINQALKLIGVHADGYADEFDAVGLDRFRSNEDWLELGEKL